MALCEPAAPLADLETALKYPFRKQHLLQEALTTTPPPETSNGAGEPEALRERPQGGNPSQSHERLEFLGDAVLGLAITQILIRKHRHRTPGGAGPSLHTLRCDMVKNEGPLLTVARQLRLDRYISNLPLATNKKKKNRLEKRNSLLANAMEAVLGAIFLDCGDLAEIQALLIRLWPLGLDSTVWAFHAVANGDVPLVLALLRQGVSCDAILAERFEPETRPVVGDSLLTAAVRLQNAELVRALLQAGADRNLLVTSRLLHGLPGNWSSWVAKHPEYRQPETEQTTPLILASCRWSTKVALHTDLGYIGISEECQKRANIIKLLVDAGADINGVANDETAVVAAVRTSYQAPLLALLEGKPDLHVRVHGGSSTLLELATDAPLDMFVALVKGGAPHNIRNCGGSCIIHILAQQHDFERLNVLLLHGRADPNVRDASGRTALHCAVLYGTAAYPGAPVCRMNPNTSYLPVLTLLVEHGADIHAADNFGMRAIDYLEYFRSEGRRQLSLDTDLVDDNAAIEYLSRRSGPAKDWAQFVLFTSFLLALLWLVNGTAFDATLVILIILPCIGGRTVQ